ncbi:MAG: hypothetical protein IIA83_00265 [Thaumarchaeota archaeon]|nr:hypothetical protein [Nitrososphaerota archaeon]
MNKLTIPALLLGVVMIAGAFAFMPVQEASTVHTTGITQGTTSTTTTFTPTGTTTGDLVFTCGADSGCVIQEIYVSTSNSATLTVADLDITVNGVIVQIDDTTLIVGTDTTIQLVRENGDTGTFMPIVLPANGVLTLDADGNNAAGTIIVTTISSGVLTATSTYT